LLSDEENEMLNKQSSCNEDFQDESRFFVWVMMSKRDSHFDGNEWVGVERYFFPLPLLTCQRERTMEKSPRKRRARTMEASGPGSSCCRTLRHQLPACRKPVLSRMWVCISWVRVRAFPINQHSVCFCTQIVQKQVSFCPIRKKCATDWSHTICTHDVYLCYVLLLLYFSEDFAIAMIEIHGMRRTMMMLFFVQTKKQKMQTNRETSIWFFILSVFLAKNVLRRSWGLTHMHWSVMERCYCCCLCGSFCGCWYYDCCGHHIPFADMGFLPRLRGILLTPFVYDRLTAAAADLQLLISSTTTLSSNEGVWCSMSRLVSSSRHCQLV
jgi:hypothetical protein